ncbi:MAG: EamA family transporter [Chloroflexi bacterium]|nr:EamA family transporter [Chloroflexota bacterium]
MTAVALALVLVAATIHASWNVIAKQADDKLAFFWCSSAASAVLFLPLGLWLVGTHPLPAAGLLVLAASCCLEAAYFWSLARAYHHGDLSLVYPIARGSAPLLVPVLAVVLLGERLSLTAGLGILAVVGGALLIQLSSLSRAALPGLLARVRQPGTAFALLTGAIIALYSTLDKRGVSLILPTLYAYLLFPGVCLALLPLVAPRAHQLTNQWRRHWRAVLTVGLLAPIAYGLVLVALSLAPVSSVAAAREVSVVIAAVLGTRVLREPYGRPRLLGSAVIAGGLALLVVG